jgi:dynein heavy chain 2
VTHWLPILEKELRILTPHEDFRFWLTTEPHIHFPSILLETCIKVSYEAPPGIKKNLVRLQQASSISSQPASPEQSEKATLSFTLNWLHALLQERRTYIP